MVDKTLPTLSATSAPASDSLFLTRRNGQITDEKVTGSDLKTFFNTSPAISGGTINNNVIGGVTPAAGTFTTLSCTTINTGQGAVECYAMDQAVRATDAVTFAGLTLTTALAVGQGGTGSSTASGARANLGLGSAAVQADTYFLQAANNFSDLDNVSTARSNLGLGSLATLNTINNGNWSGTDLAVLNGGTGASDASGARTNLGLVIGTHVQAQDAGLQSIAGLTTSADRMLYTTASDTYAATTLTSFARTLLDDGSASTARTTLGLGTIATQAASNVSISGGSITGIADIAIEDGGTGASTAGGARTNLGLGTLATQEANNVSISGGSVTGIADIAIADGGTGASTASGARTNLDVYSTAEVDALVTTVRKAKTAWSSYTNGGTISLTHGISGITDVTDITVSYYLRNVTAEAGYVANDIVDLNHPNSGTNSALQWGITTNLTNGATSVTGRIGSAGIAFADNNTGARAIATAANWELLMKVVVT